METALSEFRARAVASLERASMTRATIMATTRSRRRLCGTSDEGMQVELLEGAEDGGDVAVGVAAQAGECSFGIDQRFAFESSADEIDDVVGEMGDIAEGLVLDLAVLAEGSAQQMGVVGLVFIVASSGGYVDCAISGRNGDDDDR